MYKGFCLDTKLLLTPCPSPHFRTTEHLFGCGQLAKMLRCLHPHRCKTFILLDTHVQRVHTEFKHISDGGTQEHTYGCIYSGLLSLYLGKPILLILIEESILNLDSGFSVRFYQITMQFSWCARVGCLKLCSMVGKTCSVKPCLCPSLLQDTVRSEEVLLSAQGMSNGSLAQVCVVTLPANEAAQKLKNT